MPNNQVIYPRITLAFTNESGQAFADENLTLSGRILNLDMKTQLVYGDHMRLIIQLLLLMQVVVNIE